jgi:four helix bundle protein
MVRDYRKLRVFQLADDVITDVYKVTSRFPTAERFGLTQQIRRAAVSAPCNIVEGSARRKTRDFLNFCSMAAGSANETRYLFDVAHRLDMLPASDRKRLVDIYTEVIGGLQALIASLENEA